MRIDLNGLLLILSVFTAFAYLSGQFWLADLICEFRLELVYCAVIGLIAVAIRRKKLSNPVALTIGGVVCLVLNLLPSLLVPSATKVDSTDAAHAVKVMQFNINSHNLNSEEILEHIRKVDADIVCIEEVSPWWSDNLYSLKDIYPTIRIRSRTDNFGIAVLSKYVETDARILGLSDADVPTIALELSGPGNTPLVAFATHPLPPGSLSSFALRNQQITNLANYIKERRASSGVAPKVILCGDFNAATWIGAMEPLLKTAQLREVKPLLPLLTWPSVWAQPVRIPIDHIFVSPDVSYESVSVQKNCLSDHMSVVAKLSI